jgi:hypothetical protein
LKFKDIQAETQFTYKKYMASQKHSPNLIMPFWKAQPEDFIFCEDKDPNRVIKVLQAFQKSKTTPFVKRQYEYAYLLANCPKRDLETAKLDIEYFLEDQKLFTGYLSLVSLIIAQLLSLFAVSKTGLEASRQIAAFIGIFVAFIGIYFIFGIIPRVSAWLRIIKIALARKAR